MKKGNDQNGRGKKFQDRQPGERRPRAVKPTNERPPSRNFKTGRDKGDERPFVRNRRDDSPEGQDRRSGFRRDSPRPFNRDERGPARRNTGRAERTEGGFRRRQDDDAGYGDRRKTFGRSNERPDRTEGGFRRRPGGDDAGSGERRNTYGRTSNRPDRSEGGYRRRPSGDDAGYGDRKPTGDRNRTTRSPSSFDKGDDREKRTGGRFDRADSGNRSNTGRFRDDRTERTGRGPAGGDDRRKTRRGPEKPKLGRMDKHRKSTIRGAEKNFKGSRRKHESTGRELEKANLLQGEEVRLNRYIANSGICSRREADVMISQGLVQVNGKVVTELGGKVLPGDEVKVDGRRITPEKPVYLILNKPKGYITSTSDPDGRATVMDLIDLPGKERIYPIGRLDRNTTGVLLLTNDGELAQKLMHPSFEIKKVYRVHLDQKPSKDHMMAWVNGIELEDGFMAFEQCGFVDKEDDTTLGVEIHSGRNRIVRRMFEHFGYEVVALDRVLLGEFDHLKLGRGKWRFLNDKEIGYVERLKRVKTPKKKS